MTFAFFPSLPNAPDYPGDDQPGMQTNAASTAGIIAVDHVGFNVTGGGQHQQVTFNANNVPALPTNPPVLFTNTVNGVPQLFFYTGTASQSANQYVQNSQGSTLLPGGIIMKWGNFGFPNSDTSFAVTFPVPFPTNFFSLSLLPATGTPGIGLGTISFGGTGSTSGFTAYRALTLGLITFFYIAIGN